MYSPVTNDTTLHIYIKMMEITFYCPMWIVISP